MRWIFMSLAAIFFVGLGALIYFIISKIVVAVNSKPLAEKELVLDYQNMLMLPDKPHDYQSSKYYLPFKYVLPKEYVMVGNVEIK